jgi:hypothetical protein
MKRLASLVIPNDSGFSLICDSDAVDVGSRVPLCFEVMDCVVDTSFDGGDEFEGIVFMPAWGSINISRVKPDISEYKSA